MATKEIPALLKKSLREKSTLGLSSNTEKFTSAKEGSDANNELSSLNLDKISANLEDSNNSLSTLNIIFKNINEALINFSSEKNRSKYLEEETTMEKKQPLSATAKGKEEREGPSFFSLLKTLFMNPAVLAAVAGIVYTLLPEDLKKRIKSIIKGFTEGVEDSTGGIKSVSTPLKVLGVGIATYFGARFIKSIADAITTTIKLIKSVGRMGKASKLAVAAAVGYGAVKVSQALFGKENEKEDKEEKEEPEEKEEVEEKEETIEKTDEKTIEKEVTNNEKLDAELEEKPSFSVAKPAATGATDTGVNSSTQGQLVTSPSTKMESIGSSTGSNVVSTSKPSTSSIESKKENVMVPSEGTGTGIIPGSSIGFKPSTGGGFKNIKDLIKKHEGVRTKPYKDSLGLWTVGIGHLIGDGKTLPPEYNREFSMDEVNALFDKDFDIHQKAAEKIPGYDTLNDTGKGALIDLTFNMGPSWYKKWPNFTKALENGQLNAAADNLETSKWYRQVGRRGPEVVAMLRNGGGSGTKAETKQQVTTASGMPVTTSSGEAVTSGGGGEVVFNFSQFRTPKEKARLEAEERNKGANIDSMSVQNEAAASTATAAPIITNTTTNSTQNIGKQGAKEADAIPSPIANRGSLVNNTKHLSYC